MKRKVLIILIAFLHIFKISSQDMIRGEYFYFDFDSKETLDFGKDSFNYNFMIGLINYEIEGVWNLNEDTVELIIPLVNYDIGYDTLIYQSLKEQNKFLINGDNLIQHLGKKEVKEKYIKIKRKKKTKILVSNTKRVKRFLKSNKEERESYFRVKDDFYYTAKYSGIDGEEKIILLIDEDLMKYEYFYSTSDELNYDKGTYKKRGKWGLINCRGEYLTNFDYDELTILDNAKYRTLGENFEWLKYFKAKRKNKYTVLNEKGSELIRPMFDDLHSNYNDKILASKNGKMGVYKLEDQKIYIPFVYDYIYYYSKSGEYYAIDKDDVFGISNDGKTKNKMLKAIK